MASSAVSASRSVKLRVVAQPPLESDASVNMKITEHCNTALFMTQLKRKFNLDSVPNSDVTLKDGEYDQHPDEVFAAFRKYCTDGAPLNFENCTMREHDAEVELGISTVCPIGMLQQMSQHVCI